MPRKNFGKGPRATRQVAFDNALDIYTAAENRAALLDALAEAGAVELDLARVTDIDSAGLQVLLLAKRESLASGKDLRIVAHSPAVQELFDFCNLAGYFGDPLVISARERA